MMSRKGVQSLPKPKQSAPSSKGKGGGKMPMKPMKGMGGKKPC